MDPTQAPDPEGLAGALACEGAERALRLHARGALDGSRAQALRAHLVLCPGCAAVYRATVEQRARLGRTLRGEFPGSGAAPRHRVTPTEPALALGADERSGDGPLPEEPGAEGEGARGERARAARWRRLRLRTVLMPLFFAWLILQVTGVGARPARMEVLEARGLVSVAERPYAQYEGPPRLVRGAWCHTEDGSWARIAASGAKLELGAWTSVQAEQFDPPRVRLRAGELTVWGTASVVTWIGVIDLEAAEARVRLVPGGLELDCRAGTLSYVGPLGERRLGAGERTALTRP